MDASIDADQIRGLGALLTVWAHPDDEAYLAGGLMALATDLGNPVTCVTATLGERGGPVDEQAETAWRRDEELRDALRALGVTDRVVLGLPDGGCTAVDARGPVQALLSLLRDRRPDTIVTFGRDGLTGHPDHQTVSAWVSAAVLLHDGPRPRVLHATKTPEQAARDAGIDGIYGPGLPRTYREDQLALDLRLTGDLLDRKLAALRAHHSQTRLLEVALGADQYRDWVADESFVDAPSPLGAGKGHAVTAAAWRALEVAPA